MTAFTSVAGSSNWNNGASWTGGSGSNWPLVPGDTATILANAVVTIPAAVTINCGAISCVLGTTGRTTIVIAGELDLAGTLAFAGKGALNISPGGKLDLAAHAVTNSAADMQLNFAGTSGSHCTVTDSVGAGAIFAAVQNQTIATIDYTDFSNLTVLTQLGKSNGNSTAIQHVEHSTFTNCFRIIVEGTSADTNVGLSFRFNDIRSAPTGATVPEFFYSGQVVGTNTRRIDSNTWSGGSHLGSMKINGGVGLTSFSGNVIDRTKLLWPNAGTAGAQTLSGNFWSNTQDAGTDIALASGDIFPTFNGEYFYYDGGGHFFGVTAGSFSALNSIHESPVTLNNVPPLGPADVGLNWYLPGAGTFTHTIQNCIFIGTGTPLSYTPANTHTVTFKNNTSVYHNGAVAGGTPLNAFDFSFAVETEQAGSMNGTLAVFNNLLVDQNTKPGGTSDTECAVTLWNAIGAQGITAGFNGNAGYDNVGAYVTTTIGYYQSRSSTVIPGVGTGDVQADPLFVNKNAALATWDTSLGGAGTAANAIAQMLKANGTGGSFTAGYTPAALITFVKAGLTPQNAAYKGTGQSGADIGALPVVPSSWPYWGACYNSSVIGTGTY